MKYFLDTEFIESGSRFPLILLSLGIVAEDGREFYAVNDDAPIAMANSWVMDNVVPHLGVPRVKFKDIAPSVLAFIEEGRLKNEDGSVSVYDRGPLFWGYYADYDWVVFCQLFGTMMDLPKGWPMYCRDLKQWCDALGNPELPKQTSTEHNALNDARWNHQVWKFLKYGPTF